MCEDYPCCGHERGDCPDKQGRMKCVECGKRCAKCTRQINARLYSDDDHDYGANY